MSMVKRMKSPGFLAGTAVTLLGAVMLGVGWSFRNSDEVIQTKQGPQKQTRPWARVMAFLGTLLLIVGLLLSFYGLTDK